MFAMIFLRNDVAAPSEVKQADRFASIQPIRTNKVTIQDYTFSPTVVAIKKGASVIWTNLDATSHSISGTGAMADMQSTPLAAGSTFSYSFDEPGEYIYRCREHSNMFGKIIVTD